MCCRKMSWNDAWRQIINSSPNGFCPRLAASHTGQSVLSRALPWSTSWRSQSSIWRRVLWSHIRGIWATKKSWYAFLVKNVYYRQTWNFYLWITWNQRKIHLSIPCRLIVVFSIDWLILFFIFGWFLDSLIGRLIDWLIDSFIDEWYHNDYTRWFDRLIGWLIDWFDWHGDLKSYCRPLCLFERS